MTNLLTLIENQSWPSPLNDLDHSDRWEYIEAKRGKAWHPLSKETGSYISGHYNYIGPKINELKEELRSFILEEGEDYFTSVADAVWFIRTLDHTASPICKIEMFAHSGKQAICKPGAYISIVFSLFYD
jgi:hypothetical protein